MVAFALHLNRNTAVVMLLTCDCGSINKTTWKQVYTKRLTFNTHCMLEHFCAPEVLESPRHPFLWQQWRQWRHCSLLIVHWAPRPSPSPLRPRFLCTGSPPSPRNGSMSEQPTCGLLICRQQGHTQNCKHFCTQIWLLNFINTFLPIWWTPTQLFGEAVYYLWAFWIMVIFHAIYSDIYLIIKH